MSKNTEIKFVGQAIIKQVVNLVILLKLLVTTVRISKLKINKVIKHTRK